MEALARWFHSRLGPIPRERFIPLAEETGLVLALGRWVLEEACRRANDWQALWPAGSPRLVMSVNLSAREFQCPDLVREVARILEGTGLDPAALRLEITESTMMHDAESTLRTRYALRRLGVGLAIDDFGTGYSLLSYLRRFPVDTCKVDRSFAIWYSSSACDGSMGLGERSHKWRLRACLSLANLPCCRVAGRR